MQARYQSRRRQKLSLWDNVEEKPPYFESNPELAFKDLHRLGNIFSPPYVTKNQSKGNCDTEYWLPHGVLLGVRVFRRNCAND